MEINKETPELPKQAGRSKLEGSDRLATWQVYALSEVCVQFESADVYPDAEARSRSRG